MSEIEKVSSSTVGSAEWAAMRNQAELLAQSDIIPSAYRRKPANVMVAGLTGRHFGWDVLTAMRNGHVIENQWAMKPEAMLGLVRQAGHSVTSEMTSDGATVVGKRADNGDEMTVTFTMEDARRAKLADRGTWKQYPQMMCYWRAVGMLCRLLFSDLTAGVHSTEELSGVYDEGEAEVEARGPLPLSEEALGRFRKACEDHDLVADDVMTMAFPSGVPDPLTDEHLPVMRDAFKLLVEASADSDVVDAEIVEQAENDERPSSRAQVGKIKGEYSRIRIEDRDAQLQVTADIIGREVDTHNGLTRTEANRLIEELVALPDPQPAE